MNPAAAVLPARLLLLCSEAVRCCRIANLTVQQLRARAVINPAVTNPAVINPVFCTTPLLFHSEADIWLNDPEVRQAIHAAPQDVTGPWQLCSDRIFYTANGGSMLPVHNFLVREAGAAAAVHNCPPFNSIHKQLAADLLLVLAAALVWWSLLVRHKLPLSQAFAH
jgi:hypothetical protein